MNKKYKAILFVFCALLVAGISSFFVGNTGAVFAQQTTQTQVEEKYVARGESAPLDIKKASNPVGELTNNLWLVNFAGEENPFDYIGSLYNNQSQYDFIDGYFNSGTNSLKNYYNTISNGSLSLNTNIISSNGQNVEVINLDNTREYYMQYYYYDINQSKYVKNPEGYFNYVLVESSVNQTVAYGNNFYNYSTFLANVYDDTVSSSIPEDTNMADGILSYEYAKSLADSNPNYYLLESMMGSYREYGLICDAFSKISDKMSTENQDFDNNGAVDCLSISFFKTEEKNYRIPWSELLWPHQWSVGNGCGWNLSSAKAAQLREFGFTSEEATVLANYGQNHPTLNGNRLRSYFIADFDFANYAPTTQNNWERQLGSTSTQIHETGHMLGLPDLYVYNGGANDSSCVGSWSQMCSNPRYPSVPSLMTSYERKKMGWLGDENVKEILANGTYALKPMQGIDGNNVVGYYIQDENYSGQAIYLEYRNISLSTYDKNAGSASGLLIYTTNNNRNGNSNANLYGYEIYIIRKSNEYVSEATFLQGESFGSSDLSATSNIIHFYNNKNPINSGIVIEVEEVTDERLLFSVKWSKFAETAYSLADFDYNETLYNKLLSYTTDGILTSDSFAGQTTLDLSFCEIENLDFLEKFDLSSMEYINLANNYLTENEDYLASLNNMPNLQAMILNSNTIDLSKLSNSLLENQIFNFGLQFNSRYRYFANTDLDLYYYRKNTDIAISKIDGSSVPEKNKLAIYHFSCPNQYAIGTTFSAGGFQYKNPIALCLVGISTEYSSLDNPYAIWQNEQFFSDITDIITIEGVDANVLYYDFNLPDTSKVGRGIISVTIKDMYNQLCVLDVYYLIRDNSPPTVEFTNGEVLYFYLGQPYEEYGIIIKEFGLEVDYTQVDTLNGQNNTYEVIYWNTTFNGVTYQKSTEISQIDTSITGTYIVEYKLIDSFGRTFDGYERTVKVLESLILRESLDERIYDKLLEITGQEILLADSLIAYDYIDLSDISAQTLKGMEQFDYKQSVVIDFSNNNFTSVNEISDLLLSRSNIGTLYMINNTFVSQDIVEMSNNRNKVVFGFQNYKSEYVSFLQTQYSEIEYYNDLIDLTLSTSKQTEIGTNVLKLKEYGTQIISILDLNQNIISSFTTRNILIQTKTTTFTKEYSEVFTPNYNEIFEVEGIEIAELTITNNTSSVDLTKTGEKNVVVSIKKNNNTLKEITLIITVVDTQNPTIELVGDLILYLGNVGDYVNNYANDVCNAVDGYDGALAVEKNEPTIDGYGVYTITYSATDNSGNSVSLERTVYIGTVSMDESQMEANYNEVFFLPLLFEVYDISDFEISYKLSNYVTYTTYDQYTGISFALYGSLQLNVQLVHKNNQNLKYNFTKEIFIEDNAAPIILLFGQQELQLYAGQQYEEPGYEVSDNSIVGKVTPQNTIDGIALSFEYEYTDQNGTTTEVSSLDTTKVGKYKIIYIARDNNNNVKTAERLVQIIYYPIDNARILEDNLLSKYQQGKIVTIQVAVEAEYITDPNPVIKWYVNGIKVKTTAELFASIQFSTAGNYVIQAEVVNSYNSVFSQEVTIEIYEQSIYETILIFASVVLGCVTIICFVFYFINKYRNRNFY